MTKPSGESLVIGDHSRFSRLDGTRLMVTFAMTQYITTKQARKNLADIQADPSNDFRAERFKEDRESWCVATALIALGMADYCLRPEPEQAHSTDSHVIDPQSHHYRVQIIEIHPREALPNKLFKGKMNEGYGSLKEEITTLVKAAVTKKEGRYGTSDKAALNLLIYFNPPVGEDDENGFAPTIITNFEIDIDREALSHITTGFGSVIFMSGGEAIFVKGSALTPSAGN